MGFLPADQIQIKQLTDYQEDVVQLMCSFMLPMRVVIQAFIVHGQLPPHMLRNMRGIFIAAAGGKWVHTRWRPLITDSQALTGGGRGRYESLLKHIQ